MFFLLGMLFTACGAQPFIAGCWMSDKGPGAGTLPRFSFGNSWPSAVISIVSLEPSTQTVVSHTYNESIPKLTITTQFSFYTTVTTCMYVFTTVSATRLVGTSTSPLGSNQFSLIRPTMSSPLCTAVTKPPTPAPTPAPTPVPTPAPTPLPHLYLPVESVSTVVTVRSDVTLLVDDSSNRNSLADSETSADGNDFADPNTTANRTNGSDSFDVTVTVACVIGGVMFLLAIALVVLMLIKKRQQQRRDHGDPTQHSSVSINASISSSTNTITQSTHTGMYGTVIAPVQLTSARYVDHAAMHTARRPEYDAFTQNEL
jgi:hypothetical protein